MLPVVSLELLCKTPLFLIFSAALSSSVLLSYAVTSF